MLPLQFGSNKRKFREQVQTLPNRAEASWKSNDSHHPKAQSQKGGFNASIYGAGRQSGDRKQFPREESCSTFRSKSYFNSRMLLDPWLALAGDLMKRGSLSSSLADLTVHVSQDHVSQDRLLSREPNCCGSEKKSYFKKSMIEDPWQACK
jgi:hypothetical protein